MFDNIRGIISFEAISAEPESFLNRIRESSAQSMDLRYKNGRIIGDVYRSDFSEIKRIAEESGAQISVTKKRGSIFTVKKYRFRVGILAGLALAAAMIFYLSNIVMSIEVFGSETLTDSQVKDILKDSGIRIGAFIPDIDFRAAEREIVSTVDSIAWIGIRSSGCTVQAEIGEMTHPPEMIPTTSPCNIVSTKDAQIVDVQNVYMGMLIPMLHDGVKKGDILISGTVDNGKGGAFFVHSMGEIIGRYDEKVIFSQPCIDEKIRYTDEITRKYLRFFGLDIPLYVGKNDFEEYEYDESVNYLNIFNIQIPVGIKMAEYRLYETELTDYSTEQAQELLEDKIRLYEKNFYEGEDVVILGKEVQFTETEDGMTAAVKYTLEGNIGAEREIMAQMYN